MNMGEVNAMGDGVPVPAQSPRNPYAPVDRHDAVAAANAPNTARSDKSELDNPIAYPNADGTIAYTNPRTGAVSTEPASKIHDNAGLAADTPEIPDTITLTDGSGNEYIAHRGGINTANTEAGPQGAQTTPAAPPERADRRLGINSLKADGANVPNAKTLVTDPKEIAKLKEYAEGIKNGTIKDSVKSSLVKDAQEIMEAHGYKLDKFGADGVSGNETKTTMNSLFEDNPGLGVSMKPAAMAKTSTRHMSMPA